MESQRAYQILVVLMLILPLTIFSQQQMPPFAQKSPHVLKSPTSAASQNIGREVNYSRCFLNDKLPLFAPRVAVSATQPLKPCFTIESLPFFCRKELMFEKSTSVPLRVRLGSLDYVNKLEGKENHWSVAPRN